MNLEKLLTLVPAENKQAVEAFVNGLSSERDQATADAKLIKALSANMPTFVPASPMARVDIENLLREDAVLEDDQIYYKSGDSYIRIDGARMTMKTKLAALQKDPEYDYLFENKASAGSGNKGDRNSEKSKFDQRKRVAGIA